MSLRPTTRATVVLFSELGFAPPIKRASSFHHFLSVFFGFSLRQNGSGKKRFVSLIPKKKKDPLLLKNWRPISLLNTDYKLATKCLATRLEKVLPHLTESDQTGYIKGRFVGENIRLISDIIEQHENKEGMILFLDFEKAFDSLEWGYLFKVLDVMNIGPSFLNWIHTLLQYFWCR